jgi:hypothetical protein
MKLLVVHSDMVQPHFIARGEATARRHSRDDDDLPLIQINGMA